MAMTKEDLEKIIEEEGNHFYLLNFYYASDYCLEINRNKMFGSWCGYVGVPVGSPLYGISYYDFPIEKKTDEQVAITKDIENLDVHGGITYSGKREVANKEYWFFGFDCAHCDDLTLAHFLVDTHIAGVYRTKKYVISQCKKLAKQIKAIEQKYQKKP